MGIELATRLATYDDLLALPEGLTGQIVAGELWTSPRPAVRHGLSIVRTAGDLDGAFGRGKGGPGGWHLLFEPELHLDDDVLVPDLAAWRTERMPALPDVAAIDLAADWVCEALLPGSGRLDRVLKMPRYHLHGVTWAWLIDPQEQTLEVYQADPESWRLLETFGGETTVRARPFDAIEIDLAACWLPE